VVDGGGFVTGVFGVDLAGALRQRILEVDAYARAPAVPVVEVHPDVSFATLAGQPLAQPKKCTPGTWKPTPTRRDSQATILTAP